MKMLILIAVFVAIVLVILFMAMNYRQLYGMWAIQREKRRLITIAETISDDYHNPSPLSDLFDGGVSGFWKFALINGGGKVSNETAWHAVAITSKRDLTIHHFPDATFQNESSSLFEQPAASQYNNATLIGGAGFQPTPNADVILDFSLQTSRSFYGTAGVVIQPEGTLQQDGTFAKPFNMFGISVVGKESAVMGQNGPLCYLALDWNPVEVVPLHIDSHTWHNYRIHLRRVSKSEWLGMIYVDHARLCSLSMPPFGPVEVHIWSDNYLVTSTSKRWWEIVPTMDLNFQDGGEKQFYVRKIKIHTEVR